MKATTTVKRTFMRPLNLARIGTLVAATLGAFVLAPAGCIGGWDYSDVSEGNRCNPYDSHNECSSGLQCTVTAWQVANQGLEANTGTFTPFLGAGAGLDSAGSYNVLLYCPENYCCPVDSNGDLTTSTNANCQVGCNGGAQAICTANGNGAPYDGVCDFADSGEIPMDAESDAETDAEPASDAGDGSAPVEASTEASTPVEASTEASTPVEASTPADAGDGG
jgi:hypothetical protein